MSGSCRAALVALVLSLALAAQADDEPVSLDSVDTGETTSLDAVDTGETRSLDSVDDGETVDQDSLDVGSTKSLDAADDGKTEDLDAVDTGSTESLSAAEKPPEAAPNAPAPLPQGTSGAMRAKLTAARDALVKAEARAVKANATYSDMRAHDYPRGEAAAAIVKEYEAAGADYERANAVWTELLEQVDPASLGD